MCARRVAAREPSDAACAAWHSASAASAISASVNRLCRASSPTTLRYRSRLAKSMRGYAPAGSLLQYAMGMAGAFEDILPGDFGDAPQAHDEHRPLGRGPFGQAVEQGQLKGRLQTPDFAHIEGGSILVAIEKRHEVGLPEAVAGVSQIPAGHQTHARGFLAVVLRGGWIAVQIRGEIARELSRRPGSGGRYRESKSRSRTSGRAPRGRQDAWTCRCRLTVRDRRPRGADGPDGLRQAGAAFAPAIQFRGGRCGFEVEHHR